VTAAPDRDRRSSRARFLRRIALAVLYWVAVLLVSLAVLVGVILFLESRDQSRLEEAGGGGTPATAAPAGVT